MKSISSNLQNLYKAYTGCVQSHKALASKYQMGKYVHKAILNRIVVDLCMYLGPKVRFYVVADGVAQVWQYRR
jgi:hypothetical protein